MPNANGSRAVALLLMWVLVGGVFMTATAASASSIEPTPVASETPSSPLVSIVEDSVSASEADSQAVLEKIAPGLHGRAENPSKGFASVVIHTVDVPALSEALASLGARRIVNVEGELRSVPFSARPWGAVGRIMSIPAQVPDRALTDLAALDFVLFVDEPEIQTTTIFEEGIYAEERRGIQSYVDDLRAAVREKGPRPYGSGPGVSPTSWAIASEHKAYEAWQIDLGGGNYVMGQGVNVAIVDTGQDFGHPSLHGQWATAPSGAWAGWPIMFHPASMEGLFGQGFWTAGSDFDRLPLPYWLSVNDGDSWYTNTDYTANDTNLDGFLRYGGVTTNPETGLPQVSPRANPQQYGNWDPATYNVRIVRDYYVGCAGVVPCILSQSGFYRLGVNRDDTLTGLYGEKVGILLVDSTTAGVYDTVYVDLNFNFDFTDDKPVTQADPIAVADIYNTISGGPGQDGVVDVSGGLLYFIAQSMPVSNELVFTSTGSETSATLLPKWDFDDDGVLESASAAVDVDGFFNFKPATELFLQDPVGLRYYLPGATEDLYEEYTSPVGRNEAIGFTWRLDGAETSFGPIQLMTGRPVPTNALLNGPAGDFATNLVYDIEQCDPTFSVCQALGPANYTLNTETGDVIFTTDVPDDWVVFVIYQLGTYTLEPVEGVVTFANPGTGTPESIPNGWSLYAYYDTGLPIPYSQEYGPTHGYETFIPANGDLVAFHGDFDTVAQTSIAHGSVVTSHVAARPFGNLASTNFEVFGTAPGAKIIGIAACCNVPGPVGLYADAVTEQLPFAALGYDGRPQTGDEAVIVSNSWGSGTRNSGFSSDDRFLIDYWNRYPYITPIFSQGNSGQGYGTSGTPGGGPGVIGVGAGNTHDFRFFFGFDGGDAGWALSDCSAAGSPPDPRLCTSVQSPFGPGPYGDHSWFSSRGPTLLGSPKPDVVATGSFGIGAANLNYACFGDPLFCDGNFAFIAWSGTSQSAPVTAGAAALIVQAYRAAHGGANPTNAELRELLKSGADDMHRDILQQGAGWVNALRSVRAALNATAFTGTADGVTSDTDHWMPGNYQGSRAIGFAKLMPGASTDATAITLTNRNQGASRNVQISDAVYQRVARYEYPFSLGTGINQMQMLRPSGAYGAAGLYDARGTTLLRAMPFDIYWNTGDFVKVTYTYDATAFTGATSWRLDTFNWYDDDGSGIFDQDNPVPGVPSIGWGERNQITRAQNGGGANSVWDTLHSPGARIIDGWALNPRSGAGSPIPATVIVEFYAKADWGWIRVWDETGVEIPFGGSLSIAGANGQRRITLTADVPAGTPAGMYEGALYVVDGGNTLTIPILINVPVDTFPVRLGGNVPATSLYDNSGVVQGSRSVSAITGDNRFVYATVNVVNAVGRSVIYQSILQGPRSDSEMYVYALTPDASWSNATIYGPGTMSLVRRTEEKIDSTKTNFLNKELMFHTPPLSGFIAFQVKAWTSRAETDPLDANIGIFEVFPISVSIVTNKVVGTRPISVWANVPLPNGIDTASAVINRVTTPFGGPILQDNPNDPYSSSYQLAVTLTGLITFSVSIGGSPGNDLDLYLFRDVNGNGVANPGEPVACPGCQSAGPTDVESFTYPNPVDGNYVIAVHGWNVAGGAGTFTGTHVADTIVILASNFRDVNAPTGTVPANTPSGFDLEWRFPGDQPAGLVSSFLYVSPGYAPLALVQLLGISWRLDLALPTINRALDLSPSPNEVIRDRTASVVANVADSFGVDRFSPQLFVDGVDVSASIKVLPGGAPPAQFNSLIIAYEHPSAPWDDGTHSATLNIRDVAGNLRTEIWSWTVDGTGPSINILSPLTDTLTTATTWAFEAVTEPGATVTLTVNGVLVTPTVTPEGRITATLYLTSDGPQVIVVTAADALGNTATATRTIVRDATAPGITASADELSPTNARTTTVTGRVNEDITSVWVNGMEAGVAEDGTFSAVVPLSEGPNTITIVAWDDAGNQRTYALPPIERDTVAPTIVLNSLPAVINSISTTTVDVSGTVSGADVFFVTVNGRPVARDASGAFSETFDLAVGDNVFVVQAQDDAGNVAQSVVSIAYTPVVTRVTQNYNSIIVSGVAVVLLIVGFVIGFLLASRGGEKEPEAAPTRAEARAEEELPREEPKKTEEEEL